MAQHHYQLAMSTLAEICSYCEQALAEAEEVSDDADLATRYARLSGHLRGSLKVAGIMAWSAVETLPTHS
jgi:hypothetical protein